MATRRAMLTRRQLWLGTGVVAVVALAGWLSTIAIDGLPWSNPYLVRLALPHGAPLLTGGDEVRIGGERAGQVQSVSLAGPTQAVATLSLQGGYRVGPGAAARVRPRGLAGAVYVDMTPGAAARPLPSGSEIRAGADVQLTDAVSGFDADARRALGNVLEKGGAGFAGEGATTGNAVSNAPALLSDATATLDAVRPNPGALAGLIGDARTVAGALATNALGGTVTAARRVLDATGAHSAALASAIDDLPALQANAAAVLPSTGRLLAALTSASETLRPGIAALASGIPDVVALEQRTPAVSVLGDVAGTVAPTLRALTPMLTKLAGPASGLTPLSTPVAELAGVLIPYRSELVQAPLGFTRWGNFTYDFGTGAGDRAVRFSMVLTCALARDPYPAPGAAGKERKPCP